MNDYFKNILSYRWQSGMVAWLLMRLSGIVLFLFLCFHLSTVYSAKKKALYLRLISLKSSPAIRASELLLIFLFVYHAANGLRLLLVGANGPRHQKTFILALGLTFLLTIWFWQASIR